MPTAANTSLQHQVVRHAVIFDHLTGGGEQAAITLDNGGIGQFGYPDAIVTGIVGVSERRFPLRDHVSQLEHRASVSARPAERSQVGNTDIGSIHQDLVTFADRQSQRIMTQPRGDGELPVELRGNEPELATDGTFALDEYTAVTENTSGPAR